MLFDQKSTALSVPFAAKRDNILDLIGLEADSVKKKKVITGILYEIVWRPT